MTRTWPQNDNGPHVTVDPTRDPIIFASQTMIQEMEAEYGRALSYEARQGILQLAKWIQVEIVRECTIVPRPRPSARLAVAERPASMNMRMHAALEAVEWAIAIDVGAFAFDRLRSRLAPLEPKLGRLDNATLLQCLAGAKSRERSYGRGNRGAADVLSDLLEEVGAVGGVERIKRAARRATKQPARRNQTRR